MTNSTTVTAETLQEMLEGLEGVTPGPWECKTHEEWNEGFDFFGGKDKAFVFRADVEPEDAAHIARCDPDTMREVLTLALSALIAKAQVSEAVAKPFVYGLRNVTNGNPHFDEMCVAVDRGDSDDHIEGDASLEVVALYLGATDNQLADAGFTKQSPELDYKADAEEAMAIYNAEVEAHAKLEASLIRLSDSDRQLLRMIVPSIDQRAREPNDAWSQAAAILWLLIDTTDPVAAFAYPPAQAQVSEAGGGPCIPVVYCGLATSTHVPVGSDEDHCDLCGYPAQPFATPPAPVATPTHRHVKRGTEYVLIGIGKMQSDYWTDGNGHVDMTEVAIYRSVNDGSLWVRPREEFEDGRFIALSETGGQS